MNDIKTNISLMERKISDFDAMRTKEKRDFTPVEAKIYKELQEAVTEMRKELPERPLTLENFYYDAHGNRIASSGAHVGVRQKYWYCF